MSEEKVELETALETPAKSAAFEEVERIKEQLAQLAQQPTGNANKKGVWLGPELKGWAALKAVLDDPVFRDGAFTDRIEARMQRRETVDIKKVAGEIAAELGKKYGALMAKVMSVAAARTDIIEEDDDDN